MVKTCPICLEDCQRKNIMILNCCHHFHIDCYTNYVLFQLKDIIEENRMLISIKCPMCRQLDNNMVLQLYEKLSKYVDDQMTYKLFVEEINDQLIKEFYPHLLSIVNSKRFSKRAMTNVLRKIIKNNEKYMKLLLRDISFDIE